jgi:hypothetical protein
MDYSVCISYTCLLISQIIGQLAAIRPEAISGSALCRCDKNSHLEVQPLRTAARHSNKENNRSIFTTKEWFSCGGSLNSE